MFTHTTYRSSLLLLCAAALLIVLSGTKSSAEPVTLASQTVKETKPLEPQQLQHTVVKGDRAIKFSCKVANDCSAYMRATWLHKGKKVVVKNAAQYNLIWPGDVFIFDLPGGEAPQATPAAPQITSLTELRYPNSTQQEVSTIALNSPTLSTWLTVQAPEAFTFSFNPISESAQGSAKTSQAQATATPSVPATPSPAQQATPSTAAAPAASRPTQSFSYLSAFVLLLIGIIIGLLALPAAVQMRKVVTTPKSIRLAQKHDRRILRVFQHQLCERLLAETGKEYYPFFKSGLRSLNVTGSPAEVRRILAGLDKALPAFDGLGIRVTSNIDNGAEVATVKVYVNDMSGLGTTMSLEEQARVGRHMNLYLHPFANNLRDYLTEMKGSVTAQKFPEAGLFEVVYRLDDGQVSDLGWWRQQIEQAGYAAHDYLPALYRAAFSIVDIVHDGRTTTFQCYLTGRKSSNAQTRTRPTHNAPYSFDNVASASGSGD